MPVSTQSVPITTKVVLDTTLCDNSSVTCDRSVVFSRYFSSSTNKTDHHDITEILLKLALNTIKKPILYLMFILLTKGLIGTFI
jgi:hypothetical protein